MMFGSFLSVPDCFICLLADMKIIQRFPVAVGRAERYNPLPEIRVAQFSGINAMPGEFDSIAENSLAKNAAIPPGLLLLLPFATMHTETGPLCIDRDSTITTVFRLAGQR